MSKRYIKRAAAFFNPAIILAFVVVPEPGTAALALWAGIGLLARRRRRCG